MGVPADRNSADGRFHSRLFLRGYATLLDEMRETVAGIPKQVQASVKNPILPNFPFFAHWDEFIATKKSDKKWKKDTASGAEATPRLFKELIGDLPFAQINGHVVGRFRRAYLKLPYNYFHNEKWKKLTPAKVIEEVAKLDDTEKNKIRTASNTTANKHILNLIEYCEHLRLHGKIPRGLDNAFRGHLTARPRGRAARDEHQLWPDDLNKTFFTSPLYNGCKSIHRRVLPGDEIHRDALFWVPLFGRVRQRSAAGAAALRDDGLAARPATSGRRAIPHQQRHIAEAGIGAAGLRHVARPDEWFGRRQRAGPFARGGAAAYCRGRAGRDA
jgi:hypothetical protein